MSKPVVMVTGVDKGDPLVPDPKITAEVKDSTKLDEETKKQILYEFHDAPVGGHRGMNKTFRAIKSRYTWPNMKRDNVKVAS
jgi:hypothetical protein